MTEIENFNTGIKKEGSTKVINLDPKLNIANKKEIRILLKNIAESNLENIKKIRFSAKSKKIAPDLINSL